MILLDMSQVALAAAFADKDFKKTYDIGLFRHIILNTLRGFRSKHFKEYGELVLCYDASNNWRKEHFPYYKAHRAEARKAQKNSGGLDFDITMRLYGQLQIEFEENLPYKSIKVDRCEADDIIAVLSTLGISEDFFGNPEPVLILSSDKDFKQLQVRPHIKQYSPLLSKWVVEPNPREFLKELIICGDKGDGVPNVLSPDDQIVTKKRATVMTQSRLAELKEVIDDNNHSASRNIARNRLMVDLSKIPSDLQEKILEVYETKSVAPRRGLVNYFMTNRLNMLMDSITDF